MLLVSAPKEIPWYEDPSWRTKVATVEEAASSQGGAVTGGWGMLLTAGTEETWE